MIAIFTSLAGCCVLSHSPFGILVGAGVFFLFRDVYFQGSAAADACL
jgi:hypothetical protein